MRLFLALSVTGLMFSCSDSTFIITTDNSFPEGLDLSIYDSGGCLRISEFSANRSQATIEIECDGYGDFSERYSICMSQNFIGAPILRLIEDSQGQKLVDSLPVVVCEQNLSSPDSVNTDSPELKVAKDIIEIFTNMK
jgi:hypothetical protein